MTHYSTFIEEIPIDQQMLNARGQEVLSKERPAYPVQFGQKRPESMVDIVRRMILREKNLTENDVETFADADDFEVGDDYYDYDSRTTPYEQIFEPPATPAAPSQEPPATPAEPQE